MLMYSLGMPAPTWYQAKGARQAELAMHAASPNGSDVPAVVWHWIWASERSRLDSGTSVMGRDLLKSQRDKGIFAVSSRRAALISRAFVIGREAFVGGGGSCPSCRAVSPTSAFLSHQQGSLASTGEAALYLILFYCC